MGLSNQDGQDVFFYNYKLIAKRQTLPSSLRSDELFRDKTSDKIMYLAFLGLVSRFDDDSLSSTSSFTCSTPPLSSAPSDSYTASSDSSVCSSFISGLESSPKNENQLPRHQVRNCPSFAVASPIRLVNLDLT